MFPLKLFAKSLQGTSNTMPDTNLNNSLNELNNQLAQEHPNPKTQEIANNLRAQLEPILEQPDAEISDAHKSLGEQLNLALVDLDVDHPRLSAAIRTVLDELAAVGI